MTTELAPRLGLPGTRTETSYLPPADLTFDEWCSAVNTLQAMERSVKWWLGDLLLFGESVYGADASQAFPDAYTGSLYAASTMRAAMWVSTAFPRGTRVEGATWTHHRVVADLPHDDAVAMLEEVARVNTDPENGKYVSTRQLIEQVQAYKEKSQGKAERMDGTPTEDAPSLPLSSADLTEEARAAMQYRMAGLGRKHHLSYERAWLDCILWREDWDCIAPERRPT